MIQKPVLKIMKPGKSLDSTDLRDYIFHSDHTCLKIHSVGSGQISINSGGTTGYVDISHNLGYVPAFLVYQDGQLMPTDVYAYADTSKIRVTRKLAEPHNQVISYYYASDVYNYNGWLDDDNNLVQWYYAGKAQNGDPDRSAIRWSDLAINQGQTISNANLQLRSVYTDAGTNIKFKIWGIDESNTADFGGDPTGRPKTDAVRTKEQSQQTSKFNFEDDITSLLQEVVNIGNWSSGNPFGIIIEDNGSDNGHHMKHDVGDRKSDNLELRVTLIGTGYLTSNYKVVIFKDKIA